MSVLSSSHVRFEISNEGWKRMNAGRKPYELVREAISNAFDATDVTEVYVNFVGRNGRYVVTIEDNCPDGIKDPALLSTVFMTDKEDSNLKRGRKGRGIKEFIAAAEHATVETVGHTIMFDTGRKVLTNNRTRGTKIVAEFEWKWTDIVEAEKYLRRIIVPPGLDFYVNNSIVWQNRPHSNFQASLRTHVIRDGVQVDDYAVGTVNIVHLKPGEREGWLYELGIPVQPLSCRFHIDVQLRIPMNDTRNSADEYYIKGLYSKVLEHLIDRKLPKKMFTQEWALSALSSASSDVVRKAMNRMFGEGSKPLVLKSRTNRAANDLAVQHGHKLIDVEGLPFNVEIAAGYVLPKAEAVAAKIEAAAKGDEVQAYEADPRGKVTALTQFVSERVIGTNVEVRFFKKDRDFTGHMREADFCANSKVIRFNTNADLGLEQPLNPKFIAVLCHELAHNAHQEHNDEFRREVERISGEVAMLMIDCRLEVLAAVAPVVKRRGVRLAK